MIAIDTSALIAILLNEPEGEAFERIIFDSEGKVIGAPTAFELALVLERRRGPILREAGQSLVDEAGINVVPFTPDLTRTAIQAFLAFGKGRHPAALNYGDCMSYALAKSLDCPLLFKGEDFIKTDIVRAV